ncbi:elongator complex protein 4-like isoform X2 [Glandiceps talaboti]
MCSSRSSGTSFQKKRKIKFLNIPGTRPSLHNGGGVPVGTVLLIEEDKYGSCANLLLKYSLAEGIICRHELFLSFADLRQNVLQNLPKPIDDNSVECANEEKKTIVDCKDHMKIAWRYEHLSKQQTAQGVQFGHYYDLSQKMDAEFVKNVKCTHHQIKPQTTNRNTMMNSKYSDLLCCIQHRVNAGKYNSTCLENKDRNILRIVIQSLGSPHWDEETSAIPGCQSTDQSLLIFLQTLRSLMRSSLCVCLITVPTHLFQDNAFIRRMEQLCDTVVKIDSFVGSDKDKNPVYKDYHGLFTIQKLPRLNSLTSYVPESFDLAFKLKKKKFVLEKLHLPPDLSARVSRSQGDAVTNTTSSNYGYTSNNPKKSLDF